MITPPSSAAEEAQRGVTMEAPVVQMLGALNVAVTFFAALTSSVQVEPAQSPEKPLKAEDEPAVGVRVTMVPERKLAEQVGLQLIPVGEDATESALPARVTFTWKEG